MAADIFGVPVAEITAESSPDTLATWDSIQHLQFVLALEAEFGIELEPEEIEQIRSVGAAEELVSGRRR
jgi:acyl carrier protein